MFQKYCMIRFVLIQVINIIWKFLTQKGMRKAICEEYKKIAKVKETTQLEDDEKDVKLSTECFDISSFFIALLMNN